MKLPKNILIIRNDKLGDFMLAYPTFNVVKKLFPAANIYALIPEYTRPMAELCPWIDEIIIDDKTQGLHGILETTSKLKHFNFDAALCLHSSPRIALSLLLARIPHRFAPASRIDQIFYNHRLTQRRSRSEKPEYEYNVDIANFMGKCFSVPQTGANEPPYLKLAEDTVDQYKKKIYGQYHLKDITELVIVHPGSGGSAINLSIGQYAELISHLSANESLFFLITAGPNEEEVAQQLSSLVDTRNHAVHYSSSGLKEFTQLLSIARLFISGSTGVLHIAGALNKSTVAFYPSKLSATSLRWQPLNNKNNRLSFTVNDKNNMDAVEIDLNLVSESIFNKFLNVK